jgi:hypothetical protein
MPVNWDPGTFQEFRRAVGAGECEVVLHGWTGDWPKKSRLEFLWFFSERWFIRRLTASERDFGSRTEMELSTCTSAKEAIPGAGANPLGRPAGYVLVLSSRLLCALV